MIKCLLFNYWKIKISLLNIKVFLDEKNWMRNFFPKLFQFLIEFKVSTFNDFFALPKSENIKIVSLLKSMETPVGNECAIDLQNILMMNLWILT